MSKLDRGKSILASSVIKRAKPVGGGTFYQRWENVRYGISGAMSVGICLALRMGWLKMEHRKMRDQNRRDIV